MKIKKGDTIIVTAGKDLGKKGKVERVLPKKAMVVVTGINMYKRNMKKRDEKNPGGIVEFPRAMGFGKIAIVCPSCKKPTRVGSIAGKGGNVRICKKCKGKI